MPRQTIAIIAPFVVSLTCLIAVLTIPMLISNSILLFVLNPGLEVGWYIWPGMWIVIPVTVIATAAILKGPSNLPQPVIGVVAVFLAVTFWTIVLINIITTPTYVISENVGVRMLLAGREVPYTMRNGSTVHVSPRGWTGCIIINDSPRAARLEEVVYSTSIYGHSDRPNNKTPIAGYSVVNFDGTIDYLGPNNPPPTSLPVHVSGGVGGAIRHWLNW
jgi:hypothetical protein